MYGLANRSRMHISKALTVNSGKSALTKCVRQPTQCSPDHRKLAAGLRLRKASDSLPMGLHTDSLSIHRTVRPQPGPNYRHGTTRDHRSNSQTPSPSGPVQPRLTNGSLRSAAKSCSLLGGDVSLKPIRNPMWEYKTTRRPHQPE